jgi:hypothetical protein
MAVSDEAGEWVESAEEKRIAQIRQQVLERMQNMTPDEFFQSVVRAGIYTPEGELRVEYGGTGRDADTDEGYCTTPVC